MLLTRMNQFWCRFFTKVYLSFYVNVTDLFDVVFFKTRDLSQVKVRQHSGHINCFCHDAEISYIPILTLIFFASTGSFYLLIDLMVPVLAFRVMSFSNFILKLLCLPIH